MLKSSKEALVVLNTLSSPACGLAHERMVTNKEGLRVDAQACPAQIRSTRISCAHCFNTETRTDARKTFLRTLEFLRNHGDLSQQEYEEMKTIVLEADFELTAIDGEKNMAMHELDEALARPELFPQGTMTIQAVIDRTSEKQREIAGELQELLELARARCAALA